jgi:hypothetical protein
MLSGVESLLAKNCKGEGIRTPLGHQAQASRAPLNLYKILSFVEYSGLCMLKFAGPGI